ncbi:MAG: asparagine synthase (glutamine-hydrolyzing) [Pirellula sp.]
MCGIAGALVFEKALLSRESYAQLEASSLRMVDAILHRGPDDGGLIAAPPIWMGHRRLSILDTSINGHQPMGDSMGRYWISYNGEIYNYKELRSELQSLGATFRTATDTEVLLHGYERWGKSLLHMLDGMFAFAIWDRKEQSLWLARDGVGIKPLFFTQTPDAFLFASEIKSLLAWGVTPQPDLDALHMFLTFGYSVAPNTGFAGIQQLKPGHELTVSLDTPRPTIARWYRLPYPEAPTNWSRSESADRLQSSLDRSVKSQLQSDVPLGAFLSGGLDSSAIVACMQVHQRKPIHTFTCSFSEASFDESQPAYAVAKCFGTDHHSPLLAADQLDSLLRVIDHAEDPIADNSLLSVWALCQSTSPHVTVALSGDGADELLAGYSTYRATSLSNFFSRIPSPIRHRLLKPLLRSIPATETKYSASMLAERFLIGAERAWPNNHCSWRTMIDAEISVLVRVSRSEDWIQQGLDAYAEPLRDAPYWLSPLEQMLHMDLSFHLPNDMLVKVDRMSMAHSLEVRVPFLSNEVIQTALAIPPQWKLRGRSGKLVLRDAMRHRLPSGILARKKAGFVIPIESWLRGAWGDLLRRVVNADFCQECQILHWPGVRSLLEQHQSGKRNHAYALFTLLVFALWWRRWIQPNNLAIQFPSRTCSRPISPTRIHRLPDFHEGTNGK